MQRLNSPDQDGVLHFLTLNVRERKTPFRRPEYARMIVELLRFECDRHPAKLAAFVVMPDHLHALLGPEDGQITRFLRRFKANATHNLDHIAAQNKRQNERDWLCAKGPRELWQDSKYSLPLYSRQWIREKIEYIHQNPVKNGLVENAEDWVWSSFGAYHPELGYVPPVKVDVVELY
ncbi:MAG: transposase [Armatimonadetes bacterium]|nr:transposase [Armatimonadota bacterium]